jgi:hypothetical protein
MNANAERDDGKQVSVRLNPVLYATIARAAAEQDRSVSAQIRFLAAKALENQEQAA